MQVGRTALMIAAREGDKEIFDLQLEYDADVVQVDWRGRAVIHLAAWKNQKTIVDHLLCCWGVDVDMVDLDGFTPLCWAVMAGHVDCVDVLLVHGADPNHKSKKDVSPIDIAKAKGYTVIASMMMEALRSPSRQYATSVISKLKEKVFSGT
jgi:ankyrin repeat protein